MLPAPLCKQMIWPAAIHDVDRILEAFVTTYRVIWANRDLHAERPQPFEWRLSDNHPAYTSASLRYRALYMYHYVAIRRFNDALCRLTAAAAAAAADLQGPPTGTQIAAESPNRETLNRAHQSFRDCAALYDYVASTIIGDWMPKTRYLVLAGKLCDPAPVLHAGLWYGLRDLCEAMRAECCAVAYLAGSEGKENRYAFFSGIAKAVHVRFVAVIQTTGSAFVEMRDLASDRARKWRAAALWGWVRTKPSDATDREWLGRRAAVAEELVKLHPGRLAFLKDDGDLPELSRTCRLECEAGSARLQTGSSADDLFDELRACDPLRQPRIDSTWDLWIMAPVSYVRRANNDASDRSKRLAKHPAGAQTPARITEDGYSDLLDGTITVDGDVESGRLQGDFTLTSDVDRGRDNDPGAPPTAIVGSTVAALAPIPADARPFEAPLVS